MWRIVTVTPAGRRRNLKTLVAHLLANRAHIDEHHFWLNTEDPKDIAWIEAVAKEHSDFFKIKYLTIPFAGCLSIHHFFRQCIEPDTIYVRLDDDICWIAPDMIKELIKFRLANRKPFLVYANTINNAICSHIHQRQRALSTEMGICSYAVTCNVGWGSGPVAATIHAEFLKAIADDDLDRFKFNCWELYHYERTSINCICWFGADFAAFKGEVGIDEEDWLSVEKPRIDQRPNVICGMALVAHFAFRPQREYLEQSTELINSYRAIAEHCLQQMTPEWLI